MRRFTLAAALVAALLIVDGTQAVTTVTWDGGPGNWRDPASWNSGSTALVKLGSIHGWDFDDGVVDPHIVIDGSTSNVYYDQNTEPPVGGSRDFRLRPGTSGATGEMTISGGATFWMETNDDADPDGQWTQINNKRLTVTGAGSLFRRAFGGSGYPNVSAGKLEFRGRRMEPTGITEVVLADGGRIENDGGQINFGKLDGSDVVDSTVQVTIDGASSIDSRGGANWDYLGGILGGAGNGSINFFRQWDDTANGGAGGITDEDYSINFTGHGGSITVDGNNGAAGYMGGGSGGILVVQRAGPTLDPAGFYVASFLNPVTYEQLWSGLDRGEFSGEPDGAPGIEDIPAGMLQASGLSGATGDAFGDYFTTSGAAIGFADYKVTSIQGAIAGGSKPGDINGDLSVNAVDADTMFAAWGPGPGKLSSQGDIDGSGTDPSGSGVGDGHVNAIDAGVMFAGWSADPSPAASGTATAEYNAVTGEIIVSVADVNNWYIQSDSGIGLSGPESPVPPLPVAAGTGPTNQDDVIGETGFLTLFSYTDVSLGQVAQAGLPFGDLTIWSNAGLGAPLVQGVVEYVPEPATLLLAMLGIASACCWRRRR